MRELGPVSAVAVGKDREWLGRVTGATRRCTKKRQPEKGQLPAGLRPSRLLFAIPLAVLFLASPLFAGQAPGIPSNKASEGALPTLTTARQAHDLTSKEAARHYPVHLRAVVTYYDPDFGHDFSSLFVNDASGGIYIRFPANRIASLPSGTLVDVRGVSGNGSFAPYVELPQVQVIGPSHLPTRSFRVTHSSLFSGEDDGKWVEVEGIVRSVSLDERHVMLRLFMADGAISVTMMRQPGVSYSGFADAKVRIHANVAPLLSRNIFRMIGARLMAPDLSALEILEPAPANPFMQPIVPIDDVSRWDQISKTNHRVHLRGLVTLLWPGSSLCIRDGTGAICAQTTQDTPLAAGTVADVIGFATAEGEADVLTDASYKDTGKIGSLAPAPSTAEEALDGKHNSQLIQIDGLLIGRGLATSDTTLLLSAGPTVFTAILPKSMSGSQSNGWQVGSRLRLTGICSVQLDEQSSAVGEGIAVARSFRVLLLSPADVIVVQKPSWWTPVHAVLLLTFALAATMLVLVWVITLRKRVSQQADQLRKSEVRFRYMAQHDALTGLANRPVLQDRLSVALEGAKRRRSGLTIMMLDLDKFKQINDGLGHHAGDEVLRITASRMVQLFRKSDTVARLGGDEFVALLLDLDDRDAVAMLAAKVVAALAVPIQFEGNELQVSASVGVCIAASGLLDADALMKIVDAALYRAKARGRNCFEIEAAGLVATEQPVS